jgi:glycosyltransferase involved in cell wall biosynthesis
MLQLANEPSLVDRLGAAARQFAEAHTWERAAEATERHLHDIIAGSA